jgi:hypothetical protein
MKGTREPTDPRRCRPCTPPRDEVPAQPGPKPGMDARTQESVKSSRSRPAPGRNRICEFPRSSRLMSQTLVRLALGNIQPGDPTLISQDLPIRRVSFEMEPVVGIEPTTDGLQNRCSTAELNWLNATKLKNCRQEGFRQCFNQEWPTTMRFFLVKSAGKGE